MEESNRQKWERYIQNLRRVRTLSRPQFPPETAPEFLLEAIQGNAVRCFDLMKENNALLGELVYTRDAKTLSDSDIAELEEAAGRLFNYANSEDCGVAYKIHELLLKAARFRDDVPMIVRELYYNGITLHYINVRDEDHDVNLLWPRIHAFFLEGANYIARYEELDKETRQYIIRCVGNIRAGGLTPDERGLPSVYGAVRPGDEHHHIALLPGAGPGHPLGAVHLFHAPGPDDPDGLSAPLQ